MLPREDSPQPLVGDSPRMRQLQRMIDKLGNCKWPVLLLGETGTGKEVVARAIHRINPLGPFVPIDCSSLVGPLMESELFGHAKGSFTGAIGAKTGLIELADGGTAFLDEIGELPLDLQSKLLRVLQEKEFRPVGGLQTKRSDFRILAATNRDLAREVERGTFRRDLYYRLNVVSLRLTPLRDRKEDVHSLITHFVGRYGTNHVLTQEALDVMFSYDWPGNVRELENCIQHMVAINSGPLLHVSDLPSTLQNHWMTRRTQSMAVAAGAPGTAPMNTFMAPASVAVSQPAPAVDRKPVGQAEPFIHGLPSPPILPLVEMERRAIIQALEYTRGDRGIAANLLGIGRTTLYRKLKEYQLAS
jgi:DNA-binding NtrC family response regulator